MARSQTTIVSQEQARQIPSTALVKGPSRADQASPGGTLGGHDCQPGASPANLLGTALGGGRLEGGPGPPVHAPCHMGPRLLCGQLTSRVGVGGVEAWPARGLQRSPRNKNTRPQLSAHTLLSFPQTGHNCNQIAGEGRPTPAWAPRAPPAQGGRDPPASRPWGQEHSPAPRTAMGTAPRLEPALSSRAVGDAWPEGHRRHVLGGSV